MIDPVETAPVETAPVEIAPVEEVISNWGGGLMTGAIRNMIGTPPSGFEFIEYAVGAAFFIILIAIVASVFVGFSKMLGAK